MTKALMRRLDEGKLYYSISEVCAITGLEQHVLRYWESEFPQLKPKKNRAGNRAYRSKEIKLVRYIKYLLYDEMYTIQGAKRKLAEASGSDLEGQINLLGPIPGVVAALPENLNVAVKKRRLRLREQNETDEEPGELVERIIGLNSIEPRNVPKSEAMAKELQSIPINEFIETLQTPKINANEITLLEIRRVHHELGDLLAMLTGRK